MFFMETAVFNSEMTRRPLIRSSGKIRSMSLKVNSVSGAYWTGSKGERGLVLIRDIKGDILQ